MELLFELAFWILYGLFQLCFKNKSSEMPQLERLYERNNVTGLESSAISAGLNYTKTTASRGRHSVRCTLGPYDINLSYGPVKGSLFGESELQYTLECVVPLNPRTHSFPLFALNSDLSGCCFLVNSHDVDEIVFSPSETIGYDLSREFSFFAGPENVFMDILTPEVSIKLRQLKALFGNDSLTVLSELQVLRFTKPVWQSASTNEFSLFIPLVLELVSALFDCVGPPLQPRRREGRLVPSSISSGARSYSNEGPLEYLAGEGSIKLLETTTFSDADIHCQICGDLIGEEYVLCTACNVPHHRDCWHYNGRCSTFGCMCTACKDP